MILGASGLRARATRGRIGLDPDQPEVAGTRHRLDHAGGALMGHIGHGEAEMEAAAIAHGAVAAEISAWTP